MQPSWLVTPGLVLGPPYRSLHRPTPYTSPTFRPAPIPQEYARARVLQFAQAFASRLNPTVGPAVVQQAAVDCLASLPPPDYTGVALEQRDLQLVFRHDCL